MKQLRQQHIATGVVRFIDPRIRLLAAALLLMLVVSSASSLFPWVVAGVCLPATLLCGMSLRLFCLRMLHPLGITLLVLLLKICLGPGHAVELLQVGGYALMGHPDGVQAGLLAVSRIMGAVSVAVLLCQVMSFTETMAALAWLRVPAGLVEVSLFAWRSLFMLYDDAGIVYMAQKNRLGYCGMRRGLRSFGAMAGMLTIRALDGSRAMTTAMTQRGYDGSLPLLRQSQPALMQFAGLMFFALAATAAWTLQN